MMRSYELIVICQQFKFRPVLSYIILEEIAWPAVFHSFMSGAKKKPRDATALSIT